MPGIGGLSIANNLLANSVSLNLNRNQESLQTEAQQLLLEVNRLSQNTNFNGQALLDGSHAGATIVRLQEDQNNDNVASVNLAASESAIRDLNVGQETT